jgi:hypothetical protein
MSLSNLPTLEFHLGDWIKENLSSGDVENPILIFIKGEGNQELCQYIRNLERYLKVLDKDNCGQLQTSTYLEHLVCVDKFWQGYTEIETAALYKKVFEEVELDPKLSNNSIVDFSFCIDGREIFVEASALEKSWKFISNLAKHSERLIPKAKEHKNPESYPINRCHRIHGIFSREAKQFRRTNVPSLIIYQLDNTEFNGCHFAECLEPSVFDSDPDPELRKIGGIICYKRSWKQQVSFQITPIRIGFNNTFSGNDMEKMSKPFIVEL